MIKNKHSVSAKAKKHRNKDVAQDRWPEYVTTIITDLDGTLIEHCGDICKQHLLPARVLPGVLNKIRSWTKKNYHIIIITGRAESTRSYTEKQLTEAGILYHQLIMNVDSGSRVLINDLKTDRDGPTAIAINLERNKGLGDIKI